MLMTPTPSTPSVLHSAYTNSNLIAGGDFNIVLNPNRDRLSSPHNHPATQHPHQDRTSVKFGLCVAWGSKHSTNRKFMVFSSVDHAYSHLDLFLSSSSVPKDISETQIYPITISDLTHSHKHSMRQKDSL